MCNPAVGLDGVTIPFVQLGAEHTVAPGMAVEFNHGEVAAADHSNSH